MNSIIVAHRNRKKCLQVFLKSLSLSAKKVKDHSFELVITDLNSRDGSGEVVDKYSDLPIKFLKVKYNGPFWKTKALNHCVKYSSGDLITMVDVDSVLMPNFLSSIESFFKDETNRHNKLAHRVRFLTPNISKVLMYQTNKLDEHFLKTRILRRLSDYPVARERYTAQERLVTHVLRSRRRINQKWFSEQALGNSHYTMSREDFMTIGGYDENFVGHGLEDLDFNLRAFRYLKRGTLRNLEKYTIFHLSHTHEKNWHNEKLRAKNRIFYRANKTKKVSSIHMRSDWGEFNVL
ncbi:MAG: glycosyltransferase family 2 protein [Atribacterota bacterium]